MRWLFLLLVVLNVFYYVWHQQEAPVRVKEVVSLSLYKGSQQDIRLLSEARPLTPAGVVPVDHLEGVECTYLGYISSEDQLRRIQRRLADMDILNRPGFSRHLASSLRNVFQTLPVTADC